MSGAYFRLEPDPDWTGFGTLAVGMSRLKRLEGGGTIGRGSGQPDGARRTVDPAMGPFIRTWPKITNYF